MDDGQADLVNGFTCCIRDAVCMGRKIIPLLLQVGRVRLVCGL